LARRRACHAPATSLAVSLWLAACSDSPPRQATADAGAIRKTAPTGEAGPDASTGKRDASVGTPPPDAASAIDAAPRRDAGSSEPETEAGACPCVEPAFQSDAFAGCLMGSPLLYDSARGSEVIVASGDGVVAAIDPGDGRTLWTVPLPARAGQMAHVAATPVLVPGGRLVVVWQDIPERSSNPPVAARFSHRAAVVDLEAGALDDAFATLSITGSARSADGAVVDFQTEYAFSRAALVHAPSSKGRGYVYVSFGNARDIQPFHGWVFELELDAWHDAGAKAAISATLVTTPETDCGRAGHSGAREMVCGGGVWAPAGPQVVPTGSGFELLIPTGNGALDVPRRDYAHTLMRIRGPGLRFDDGCDPAECASWDIDAPSLRCMQSCESLFIPRFAQPGTTFGVPDCDGLSFFGCYAARDWDLGADSPAVVDVPGGPRVVVLPAKDGSVYLADFAKLGTLYDRLKLVEPCGSHGATCTEDWAGMMVTRPEVAEVGGEPIAVIATFNPDDRNPAGLVGLRIVAKPGGASFEKIWEAPSFDEPAAVAAFRSHPSRVRLMDFDGEPHAAVVDVGTPSAPGSLYLVRVRDGAIRARRALAGPGQRFAQPLGVGDHVLIASCEDGARGPGRLEAFGVR
jgi:hypothetical protein